MLSRGAPVRLIVRGFCFSGVVQVGAALRAAVAAGEATRANLCIVSKLGMSASAPEDVEAACRATLAETGLEYLDCYLMHWPVCSRVLNNIFHKSYALTGFRTGLDARVGRRTRGARR